MFSSYVREKLTKEILKYISMIMQSKQMSYNCTGVTS